jgi:hypothetical protein
MLASYQTWTSFLEPGGGRAGLSADSTLADGGAHMHDPSMLAIPLQAAPGQSSPVQSSRIKIAIQQAAPE